MIDIKRKSPKQSRSKVVVDSILEATTHILINKGIKNLTTNHIAELAGVSIGSLYQYFANKESIIAELIEHHKEKEFKKISKIMNHLEKHPTCQKNKLVRKSNIRLVIKSFIDIHLTNLELSRILQIQTQHISSFQTLKNTTSFLTKKLHSLLDKIDSSSHKENFTRAYILSSSLDALIQKTLIEKPQLFTKPEFLNELVNLSVGYLQTA